MDEKLRTVLILRYEQELTLREISVIMELPLSSANRLLKKAEKKENTEFEKIAELFRERARRIPYESAPSQDLMWMFRKPAHKVSINIMSNEQSANRKGIQSIAAIATSLVILSGIGAFYFFSKEKEAPVSEHMKAIVVFVKGSATVMKGDEKTSLHIGDILKSGDTVNTDANSQVDLSLTENTMVRIRQNSVINLREIARTVDGGERIKLGLESGSALNHVTKLGKKDDYKVYTPTSVASVRGTSFEVQVKDGHSTITVGEGAVHVEELVYQRDEYILEANRQITITDRSDEVIYLEEADKRYIQEAREIFNHIKAMGSDTREMIKSLANVKSEAELKKVFQRDIELIKLKDGRTIRGIIVSMKEGKLLVQTVKGSHVLQKNDVFRVKYLTDLEDD